MVQIYYHYTFNILKGTIKSLVQTHVTRLLKDNHKSDKSTTDVFSTVRVQQKIKIPLNHSVNIKSIHKILAKRLLK